MSNTGILNYINQNSDYVFVNKNKLNSFINNIDNWDYNYWLDSNDLLLSEKEKIIFAFLCESRVENQYILPLTHMNFRLNFA